MNETTIEKKNLKPNPRTNFLSAHPKEARRQAAQLSEFRRRFSELIGGGTLSRILHGIVEKAETARQIGIVLIEFEGTLPGGKLTRDFYQQLKDEFIDEQGRSVSFELLEWFMRVARSNLDPITNFEVAMKWRQPLMLATGENDFRLESVRQCSPPAPTKDEWGHLKDWMSNPDLEDWLTKLRGNPNYYPGGRMRPDLRAMMAEEWRPKFKVLDEFRADLGL